MLVNLADILAMAAERNMAIAAFNTPSLEAVRASLDAAEETGLPVIIQHAQCHDDMCPLSVIGPVMVALAGRSSAKVCVHLDHGESLGYVRDALELGFTGVMYDGSALPYEENVANSRRAARMVEQYDCGLECELGSLGARQGDVLEGSAAAAAGAPAVHTDPDQAAAFVEATGTDALAVSFGTVHGLYRGEPHLAFDVLEAIGERTDVPLVMHGGSGVSDSDYRRAIAAGIRKINYYTYGVKFAAQAACERVDRKRAETSDPVFWHDMTIAAYERLLEDCKKTMLAFANR